MAAGLEVDDGNPVWLSQAIVPSTDTVVSLSMPPSLAAIHVGSTGVSVYVKVDNIGTVAFGVCACATPVPASWPVVVPFGGFFVSTAPHPPQTESKAGVTFTYRNPTNPAGDTLSGGGVMVSLGLVVSGKRAWAWSPDGRLFAHVYQGSGNDWYLNVVALQNVTRSDGTVVPKNQSAIKSSGIFGGPFDMTAFGWAGSRAVVAAGVGATSGISVQVACPLAPPPGVWGTLMPSFPNVVDWTHLVSPCESFVAFVPQILQPTMTMGAFLISTVTGMQTPFRKNNAPTSVTIRGPNPSLTTTQHAANGLTVDDGTGQKFTVDDPECTMVPGGVMVTVDRVKASTLPSANLGVKSVGSAALSILPIGASAWVKVPNPSGWANQGETHWCLLAQAYTADGTTIMRPWNGQAVMPPSFPLSLPNCAQRNIEILP